MDSEQQPAGRRSSGSAPRATRQADRAPSNGSPGSGWTQRSGAHARNAIGARRWLTVVGGLGIRLVGQVDKIAPRSGYLTLGLTF